MQAAETTGGPAAPQRAATWLAAFAAAFWVYYFVLRDVLGLLTVDEIYFIHVFWLMAHGLEPVADFYSVHLPAYFHMLGIFVPREPGTDLGFVWPLRATNLAVGLAYVGLLYRLCRREFLLLLPFLFIFVTLARMAEIRPDTFGLLLVNAAWWSLLRGIDRRSIVVAAVLAALSLFFSARAAIVVAALGLLLLWLCLRRRDARTAGTLLLVAAGFVAVVAIIYFANPASFVATVRAVYFGGVPNLPTVPLWQRVLPLDRLLLLAMVVAALVAGLRQWRLEKDERSLVIAFACATQILLVLVDPSPYQYVYGWAALPALAGLARLGRQLGRAGTLGLAAASGAVTIGVLSAALPMLASPPRPGSFLRISYDAPFGEGELQAMRTPRLLQLMVTTDRQEGMWNQLALYEEICRRLRGPVLTKFYASPICLPDARYDWVGVQWPDLLAGEPARAPRGEFERLVAEKRPPLVAWGKQHYTPPLSPWGRRLLRDYDVHDGFALRRVAEPRRPGASAE